MQDLMTYLSEEFKKEHKGEIDDADVDFDDFVLWCQQKLKKNPPKTVVAVDYGVGFRLMDETEVAIVVQPGEPLGTAGVQINQAGPARNIPDTRSAQIIGKQETRVH